jgi:hypothetical protein
MVSRKEKQRHQKAGDCDGAADLHHALRFVVIGGEQLVVKETVKKVAYKVLELTLLAYGSGGFSLHRKRENRMSGWSEEAGSLKHGEPP